MLQNLLYHISLFILLDNQTIQPTQIIIIPQILHKKLLQLILTKDRPDLGKDERYGRRVLFEFNKAYPVVMSPMLSKYELEELFMEYLGYYYDLSRLDCLVV